MFIRLHLFMLVLSIFSILFIECTPVRDEYDEPSLDFIDMYNLPRSRQREFWNKRMNLRSYFKRESEGASAVKRPQQSDSYYYDLYRQSMLPTNEFIG